MFTTQHHTAIAKVVSESTVNFDGTSPEYRNGQADAIVGLMVRLSAMFETDNDRFRSDLFFTACGH